MIKKFDHFATHISHHAGTAFTFFFALTMVIIWALVGPMFSFSENWQLTINTTTTIITFLMVFVIQNTQNRHEAAMQAKLDALILAVDKADNSLIGIENE